MPVLLDTSFIIAFDNERDVHHKNAAIMWIKIDKMNYGQYFISDHIFDEIIGVSLRKIGKEKTLDLCNRIIKSIPIINIDNHLFKESWNLFKETNLNLSFTDCTNVALIGLFKSNKIATFDEDFNKIKGIEVIR